MFQISGKEIDMEDNPFLGCHLGRDVDLAY
jgi:hypothetical protein